MALSIKSPEADRLVRELVKLTGETLTDAIVNSLRERLAREQTRVQNRSLADRLMEIGQRLSKLPVLDDRTAEEILDYDSDGFPS